MQTTYLKINPADSVVVCLSPKKKGDLITVDGRQIAINQDTPAGHKVLSTHIILLQNNLHTQTRTVLLKGM